MELYHKYFMLLLHLFLYMYVAEAQGKQRPWNNTVSGILVFGDSTVDPGNNDFISTILRSNFPPYGKDFKNQIPTGRFTNGRLPTDFIDEFILQFETNCLFFRRNVTEFLVSVYGAASYVGIKEYLSPYLDPTLSIDDLLTGVSFASAGSGFDPLTPRLSNVLNMSRQLEYFKEYKKRLESAIGKQAMEKHMKSTFFVISAGTNDSVVNYFFLPNRNTTSVSAYQQFMMQKAILFLQGLWEAGAWRIIITGLPPIGCLPAVITFRSRLNTIFPRHCVERYSSVARQNNQMLQNEVNLINSRAPHLGVKIDFIDIYTPLADMIQGPGRHGFDATSKGCCGTGFLEAALFSNPNSYVCPNASKYVFWDSIHPTEKTYFNIFNSFRSIIDDVIRE